MPSLAAPPGDCAVTRGDAIFVIGMGRSGTSAVARSLALCGGALPARLMPANFANPTGYWEPQRAAEINDAFLSAHDSSWYDGSLLLQMGLVGAAERREFVSEIADFLAAEYEQGVTIVLKEPRITGLLPYWLAAVRGRGMTVKLVHVVRAPADVAASLHKRDGLTAAHACALYLKYNLVGERDARNCRRVFVSYDDLLHDWERVVRRCITGLELDLSVSAGARAGVAAFLSPALRHRAAEATLDALPAPLRDAAGDCHAALQAARTGGADVARFDQLLSAYAFSKIPPEYRLVVPIARPPGAAAPSRNVLVP